MSSFVFSPTLRFCSCCQLSSLYLCSFRYKHHAIWILYIQHHNSTLVVIFMFATVYHLCITDVMSESVFLPFFTLLEGFILFCVTVNMSSPVDRSVHIMRLDKYFEERSASPLVEDCTCSVFFFFFWSVFRRYLF